MDDGRDSELLKRIATLTEENHRLLKRVEKRAMWANIAGIVRWAIFLLVTLGLYYYIQPYLVKLVDIYHTVEDSTAYIKASGNPFADIIADFVEGFQNPQEAPQEQ